MNTWSGFFFVFFFFSGMPDPDGRMRGAIHREMSVALQRSVSSCEGLNETRNGGGEGACIGFLLDETYNTGFCTLNEKDSHVPDVN